MAAQVSVRIAMNSQLASRLLLCVMVAFVIAAFVSAAPTTGSW